jgi:nucleotide-binding universal stress UspA family protein
MRVSRARVRTTLPDAVIEALYDCPEKRPVAIESAPVSGTAGISAGGNGGDEARQDGRTASAASEHCRQYSTQMNEVEPLFARPLLPVANEEDADRTARLAFPHVAAAGGRAIVTHVIEKAGGAPDKAPLEQREEMAEAIFERVRSSAEDAGVDVETELHYGTDVADTILDAADAVDATAIVFTPRGGKAWWDIFSGDTRDALTTESEIPVVVFPTRERAASSDVDDDSDASDDVTESTGGDGA